MGREISRRVSNVNLLAGDNLETILLNQKEAVLFITLNRPDVRNALSSKMIQELTHAIQQAPANKTIRLLVLQGSGKIFCSGADLQDMQKMINLNFSENKADALELHKLFKSMQNCPLPIISQIQGSAFGGALGLLACSDFVLAETKTKFCFSEVKLGLAPALISEFILKKSSLGCCMPWMMSGQVFDTDIAMAMGLVWKKSEEKTIQSDLEELIDQLLGCGSEAMAETKKLLNILTSRSVEDISDITSKVIAERRVSPEGQEGLKAFFEKRKPSWSKSKIPIVSNRGSK